MQGPALFFLRSQQSEDPGGLVADVDASPESEEGDFEEGKGRKPDFRSRKAPQRRGLLSLVRRAGGGEALFYRRSGLRSAAGWCQRRVGSSLSRSQSPRMQAESVTQKMTAPGATEIHQALMR